MSVTEVVIVGAARTPQGRLNGQLSPLSASELGGAAIRGALERAGVAPESVDHVIVGQVLQAGAGQNPARQAALAGGIGWAVPAVTVNKVCLSGLTAVIDAARTIAVGDAEVVVAAGMESMSNAPHLLMGSRRGYTYGTIEVLDSMAHDGLTDAHDHESMGVSTERGNQRFAVSRADQDEVAVRSHQRASVAQATGVFDSQMIPVEVPQRRGDPLIVTSDEGVRRETMSGSLAKLKPAFSQDGSITAGNSSQLSDGAAAVILTTRTLADKHGWNVLAVIGASGQVAGPDNSLHEQPARALQAALSKDGLTVDDLDFVEINEAFAAVVVRSQTVLGIGSEAVNPHGGGIALGHPIGASGTRLVVQAVHELGRRGSNFAGVALCGGGGQGEALILGR